MTGFIGSVCVGYEESKDNESLTASVSAGNMCPLVKLVNQTDQQRKSKKRTNLYSGDLYPAPSIPPYCTEFMCPFYWCVVLGLATYHFITRLVSPEVDMRTSEGAHLFIGTAVGKEAEETVVTLTDTAE
jgi:hypothetical protein